MTKPIKGCPQPDPPELVMRADGYHYQENEMKESQMIQAFDKWAREECINSFHLGHCWDAWQAALALNAPADRDVMRQALDRSITALDDWLNIYAPEHCDAERVRAAWARINEHGTIAYIADVQEQNRLALPLVSAPPAKRPSTALAATSKLEGSPFESYVAQLLHAAWIDGWASCRDYEFAGDEAMHEAFNQCVTLNTCMSIEQATPAEPLGDDELSPAYKAPDELIAALDSEDTPPAKQGEQEPVTTYARQHAAHEVELTAMIEERDHRETIIDQLCDCVLGQDRTEWSSNYYFEDAVAEVQERILELEERKACRDSNSPLLPSSTLAEQQGEQQPVAWWNGFRRIDPDEGIYKSLSEIEDIQHDIPLYAGTNPVTLLAALRAKVEALPLPDRGASYGELVERADVLAEIDKLGGGV